MIKKPNIHGINPGVGGEYTLCGRAFDDFDSGDAETDEGEVIFAQPGEKITCESCRGFIRDIYDGFSYGGKVK